MTFTLPRAVLPCAATMLALVSGVRDADACGGCFHPSTESGSSVITDHRMVFKISTTETILWDQVRYAGDPREFAWVLPVREGARVELSRDEWISALDGATRTTVTGPEIFCNAQPSGRGGSSSSSSRSSGGGGGGGGCGGGASDDTWSAPASNTDESGSSGSSGRSFAGNEQVEVVSQSVIGPYQAVTIRAAQGQGITEWLTTNGFAIPKEVVPVVDAYTRERFDFIALRLKPGAGVRAMRPVRVVTPGADTSMPLRMVTAGVGARVGLTLWVIGEGRYHTANFPDAPIDWSKLAWRGNENRSNLSELQRVALEANGGRGWVTEAAIRANVTTAAFGAKNPTLYDAYTRQCQSRGARQVPCDETALPPPDGTPEEPADAGADADTDGGSDAGANDAGTTPDSGVKACTKTVYGCDGYDDLQVAIRGLHASDVWVTRLRADLPVTALSTDLRLEPSGVQAEDDPARHTETFTDPSFDPCARARAATSASSGGSDLGDRSGGCTCRTPSRASRDAGTFLLVGLTSLVAAAIARRRRP
jgi:hypothetical protein